MTRPGPVRLPHAATVTSVGAVVAGPPVRTQGLPLASPSNANAVSVSPISRPVAPQPRLPPDATAVVPRLPVSPMKVTGGCSLRLSTSTGDGLVAATAPG